MRENKKAPSGLGEFFRHLCLQTRLTLWICSIVLLSVSVTAALGTNRMIRNKEEEIRDLLFNVADIVAQNPTVINDLQWTEPSAEGAIQALSQSLTQYITDVSLVVVCDMDSIRYSHPNPLEIGSTMVGGDEAAVVERGERYVSTAEGTLGVSVRAFVPICTREGVQVGYVTVGTMEESLIEERHEVVLLSGLFLVTGLILGTMGAILLARGLKKELLDKEPEELARLYREHEGMLEALHEGVVAIDARCQVTLINQRARQLIGIGDEQGLGVDIAQVMPTTRLPEVLENGKPEYNQEQRLGSLIIITNRIPLRQDGKVVGAIATFQDKTQLTRLAEEMTGIKQLVAAMRARSHEYMNRFHVVLGLLELGEVERAKNFILHLQNDDRENGERVIRRFKDPVIAGLLTVKLSYCREQGVELVIQEDCWLPQLPQAEQEHSLVTILGNLIDNSVESCRTVADHGGKTVVLVRQDEKGLEIRVEDNGPGIAPENLSKIFTRGFSTKGPDRGTGLYLVCREVEMAGGTIRAESRPDIQTIFWVTLPWSAQQEEEY